MNTNALRYLILSIHAESPAPQREALRSILHPWLKINSEPMPNEAMSIEPMLIEDFNLSEEVFDGVSALLGAAMPRHLERGMALAAAVESNQSNWLCCTDWDYPSALLDLVDFPLVCFYSGDKGLLQAPKVSVVGTRQPSCDGEAMCRMLGAYLKNCGTSAVSGLAFGIDAAIHRGMLRSGGKTIAVLPSGLGAIAPKSHFRLAEEILGCGGLLLSERLHQGSPMKHHFLERNRLIAALSQQVVIVESGGQSGSLNTAMHALQLGREVFAMPGSIRNPVAVGTNRLIRDGAHPLTAPEDLGLALPLDSWEQRAQATRAHGASESGTLSARLVGLLAQGGVWTPDHLAQRLRTPVYELLPELMTMVLDRRAEQMGDGYRLIQKLY